MRVFVLSGSGALRNLPDCDHNGGMEHSFILPPFLAGGDQQPTDESAELLSLSIGIAAHVAEVIQDKRRELGDLRDFSQSKSSLEDPVTVVDSLAEDLITEKIKEARPQDGLIGEEGSAASSISGITWIVDPIDGTVNFIYGHPNYAVSIAAARDGEVISGCVINVATRELYVAARGQGAYLLGEDAEPRRLQASQEDTLQTTLVGTGFSYAALRRQAQAKILQSILPTVRDIRRMGSAALDLCAVATGRLDAYYEHALNAWDFAAGLLIARESGAVVVAPALSQSGDDANLLWACGPRIAEDFSKLMGEIPQELSLSTLEAG